MNLDHLDVEVRPLAELDNKARIHRIQSLNWIGYKRVFRLLERMEWLFDHARVDRMPNMLIIGESMSGKTTLANRLQALHPAEIDRSVHTDVRPVLYTQLTTLPTPTEFLQSILEALDVPYQHSARVPRLLGQIKKIVPAIGTRVLIIDELDHLIRGSATKQRDLRDQIKLLGNELKLPIIGIGTYQSRSAFDSDQQLKNRFQVWELPPWKPSKKNEQGIEDLENLAALLKTWQSTCPLRKPSNIVTAECMSKMHQDTLGYMGYMMRYLMDAAEYAINSGEECITLETFTKMNFFHEKEIATRRVAVVE